MVSYTYDALGRQVTRTAAGATRTTQYDGNRDLVEKNGSAVVGTYVYGNELVRKDTETPLFDALGSERTITDGTQAVTATLTYSAFGTTVAYTGSSGNHYQWAGAQGYRNDADAGLLRVGARYYDMQTGRFLTRDTYLNQHPYLYCDHDPVNHVDPSGHGFLDWLKRQWAGAKETARSWFDWGGSDLIGELGEGAGGMIAKPLEGISAYYMIKEEEKKIHEHIRDPLRRQDQDLDGDQDEQEALKTIFPGRYRN